MNRLLSLINQNRPYIFFLVVLIIIHSTTNIIWLTANNAPPSWDAANHSKIALDIASKIRSFDLSGILHTSSLYPIFVHTLVGVTTLILGTQIKIMQFTGTVFFAIAIFTLYFYVKGLYNNNRIAFLSSALFSFFPIVFDQSRRLMLDIPLTAILLASLFLLQKSNNLTKTKMSIFFFISLGLLIMTKWVGIIFILIPLVLTLKETLKNHTFRQSFISSLPGIAIFLIIVLPWYLVNFTSLYFQSQIWAEGYGGQPKNILSIDNAIFYLKLLINSQITPWAGLIFIISFIGMTFSRTKHKWLLLTIITSYLLLTIISNKDPRYTIPILPFVAIIVCVVVDNIGRKFKFISALLLSSLFLYFIILTVRPAPLETFRISVHLPMLSWINIVDINDSFVKKYDTRVWNINSILNDIERVNKNNPRVLIGIENEYINPSTLNLIATKDRINMSVVTPDPAFLVKSYSKPLFPNDEAMHRYIEQVDFLILSPLNLGAPHLKNREALWQLQYYLIGDTFLSCNKFENEIAPLNTVCFVKEGEIVETASDVEINDKPVKTDRQIITGSSKVNCPWGCSFKSIKPANKRFPPQISLVKRYAFPNNLEVNLYRVEK